MTWTRIAATVTLSLAVPAFLQGQQASLAPHPSVLFVPPWTEAGAAPATLTRTYWKEGAIALGVPMGMLGALALHGLCEDSETSHPNCTGAAVGGAVFGFFLGAVPGALIGGQFKKGP